MIIVRQLKYANSDCSFEFHMVDFKCIFSYHYEYFPPSTATF